MNMLWEVHEYQGGRKRSVITVTVVDKRPARVHCNIHLLASFLRVSSDSHSVPSAAN